MAAGYQVKIEDGHWVEKDGRFTLSKEHLPLGADAILVIAPTIIGYVSPPMAVDYLPTMTVVVTLIGKDGKTELYRGFHATGWDPKREGWRYTPPVKKFRDFDNLMASPADSATALTQSAEFISASIAADLRRN